MLTILLPLSRSQCVFPGETRDNFGVPAGGAKHHAIQNHRKNDKITHLSLPPIRTITHGHDRKSGRSRLSYVFEHEEQETTGSTDCRPITL
jgi:hypothetical protein